MTVPKVKVSLPTLKSVEAKDPSEYSQLEKFISAYEPRSDEWARVFRRHLSVVMLEAKREMAREIEYAERLDG